MDNKSKYPKLTELDKKIIKTCKHDIIIDYIDTMFPYREGIMIKYCKHCEFSEDIINLNK